ncbi:MAG: hypothetical protein CL608_23330 [Anaerolineaceae bacterium]|nr:hypothetical protein [Anaerolineaceae bacterium]
MSNIFEHGYALVIGVDANQIARLTLPAVAKDVQAVYDVLIHPQRCAYNPDNVKFLKGEESTRENIMEALYWLQEKVKGDGEATAVLYYSGHGMEDKATGQYYLIPYDIKELSRVRTYAIRAEDFAAEISAIGARRMLAVLDCCHAAGMDVKDVAETAVESTAFPLELPETKDIPDLGIEPGGKAVSDLADGEGRAILNSSTGSQSSYVRTDGAMSLFTYHLIEALTGHAPHRDDASVVYVTDVMSWVTHKVKQSAKEQGRDQTPVMRTSGVFPVAMLIGGQGVAKGMGDTPPDPLAVLPQSGPTVTFNQENQTVYGHQANIAGNAQIGQIGDNITLGENAEYVRGNKTVHGDVVHGDKVGGDKFGGDKISVGSVSGSQNMAIGSGAQMDVRIQHGPSLDELTPLFAPLLQQVAQENTTAVSQVRALQEEVARGEEADDDKMANLIYDIAEAAPTVVETIVNLFSNAIVAKAAGRATSFILKRIRQ